MTAKTKRDMKTLAIIYVTALVTGVICMSWMNREINMMLGEPQSLDVSAASFEGVDYTNLIARNAQTSYTSVYELQPAVNGDQL